MTARDVVSRQDPANRMLAALARLDTGTTRRLAHEAGLPSAAALRSGLALVAAGYAVEVTTVTGQAGILLTITAAGRQAVRGGGDGRFLGDQSESRAVLSRESQPTRNPDFSTRGAA